MPLRPRTQANTSKATESRALAEAPVRDRHVSIGAATMATDAVPTAPVLTWTETLPGDNLATPTPIRTTSATIGMDTTHMTESAPTTIDRTQTGATTTTTAIGIIAATARGHAAEVGARRETK